MEDLNNKREQQTSDSSEAPQYRRHPKYYLYGGTTFLVGTTIYKIPVSLLASSSAMVTFKVNNSTTRTILDLSDESEDRPGSNDVNPIVITGSDIIESQFDGFLLALLGRLGEEDYMSLIQPIEAIFYDPRRVSFRKETMSSYTLYKNVGDIAFCFGLTSLAIWGWKRLTRVLWSAINFLESNWSESQMLQMLTYIQDMLELEKNAAFELVAFFRLILSVFAIGDCFEPHVPINPNLKACVCLYRASSSLETPIRDMVQGCTFLNLLSLGHHSSIWKDELSRDERLTLYAATVDLVSLHDNPILTLDWLETPKNSKILEDVCASCSGRFEVAWSASFGTLGVLNSPSILEDIRKLARLPQCRYQFTNNFRAGILVCWHKCHERIFESIDIYLNRLFNEQIPALYAQFAE